MIKSLSRIAISLILILFVTGAIAQPTCEEKMEALIKMICIEPNSNNPILHTPSIEDESTGMSCPVMSYSAFWEKTNEIKDDLTRRGITDLTPEQLAAEYRDVGWGEIKMNATYGKQDVNVTFPGKKPKIVPIAAGSTLMTVASDIVNGKDVVRILNIDYHNSDLLVEKDNGWAKQPDLKEVTIVGRVNVISLKRI